MGQFQDTIYHEHPVVIRDVTAAQFAAQAVGAPKNPGVRYRVDGGAEYQWNGSAWVAMVTAQQSVTGRIEFTPGVITGLGLYDSMVKADRASPAFAKTAAEELSVKAGTIIGIADRLLRFAVDTPVIMPALVAGTDYAIYACADGSIRADANWSAPAGYTAANSRKIGGFHYASGGNAAAQAGGSAVPEINEYSIWDLRFRPDCPDPRGMTLVADSFWSDIYLLGVDHHVNGSSAFGVTIADGSSPPKIPARFGGNGANAYSNMTWWVATEVLRSHGKRPPAYDEFAALAYGTTEASSGGTDPGSTILREAYTSKWGVMLATGNMYVWGADFGGGNAAAAWSANTSGRGSTYQMENVARFGGSWGDGSNSGSRSSLWSPSPTSSANSVGARGVCDHVILD